VVRVGDEGAGTRVVEDVGHLVCGEVPVDRGEPGAGQLRRHEELDQLDAVAHQRGDVAARAHRVVDEPVPEPDGSVEQLAPGAPAGEVVDGGGVGVGDGELDEGHGR